MIGVLERKGKFLWESMDNMLLIPVNSLVKKDQRFNFMVADLKPISPAHIDQAVDQTRGAMRRYRKLKYLEKDNFAIFTQDTLTDLYRQITGGIYMVMIAISSIGLLVGRRGRHEHHARLGHRADPRDRHPQGPRRHASATSSGSS